MTLKTVLFVAYGGGHIKMLVPVVKALAKTGLAQPLVRALTTAAQVVRAGLEPLQFKNFLRAGDLADKSASPHWPNTYAP